MKLVSIVQKAQPQLKQHNVLLVQCALETLDTMLSAKQVLISPMWNNKLVYLATPVGIAMELRQLPSNHAQEVATVPQESPSPATSTISL